MIILKVVILTNTNMRNKPYHPPIRFDEAGETIIEILKDQFVWRGEIYTKETITPQIVWNAFQDYHHERMRNLYPKQDPPWSSNPNLH